MFYDKIMRIIYFFQYLDRITRNESPDNKKAPQLSAGSTNNCEAEIYIT
jgi:hypothetical protein